MLRAAVWLHGVFLSSFLGYAAIFYYFCRIICGVIVVNMP